MIDVQELFLSSPAAVSSDLEEIALALLRRAGEMSTAGRDNFLAQYADAALSQMVISCPEVACAKALLAMCVSTLAWFNTLPYITLMHVHVACVTFAITVLMDSYNIHVYHYNSWVWRRCRMKMSSQPIRMKVAAHLDELLSKSRGNLCKSATMYTNLFKAAALLLEEGSTETRTHAKRILCTVKLHVGISKLQPLIKHAGSTLRERRVASALELLGPPAAPERMAQSFAFALGWDAAAEYAAKVHVPLSEKQDSWASAAPEQQDSLISAGSFERTNSGIGSRLGSTQRAQSRTPAMGRTASLPRAASVASRRVSRADSDVSDKVTLQAQGSGVRRGGLPPPAPEGWAERRRGQSVGRNALAC